MTLPISEFRLTRRVHFYETDAAGIVHFSVFFRYMEEAVGAVRKNLALASLPPLDGVTLDPQDSLLIAACLAPTAVIGGLLGAGLTHSLPLPWIRAVLMLLLGIASAKLLGVV